MYDQSDVETVYRRGDWSSWDDIVSWFEQRMRGDEQADNELSEAESHELLDGFRHLAEGDQPFTADPDAAYQALRRMQRA